jgi:hypothetical protein
MLPAAGPGLPATGRRSVSLGILLRSSLPISGSKHDLELIKLIPLGIGPLPVRNRQQRLQASARGYRLRIIHGGIISSITGQTTIPG